MNNKNLLSHSIKNKLSNAPPDCSITSFRAWLEVADVMSRDVATIPPNETAACAAKMMAENNISCVTVVDNETVAGILTETDILKMAVAKKKDFNKIRVAEIMSSPVQTISYDLSVFEAGKLMDAKCIKRLPILQQGRLVGIVTQTDLIRVLTSYGMWRDVAEIMSKNVAGIQKNASVAEAAKIMTSKSISCIVAMEANKPTGILTVRDILKRVAAPQKNPAYVKIEQVMSSPAITIPPTHSVFSASTIMVKKRIRRLIVMDNEQLCGIVTQTDIFGAIKSKLQTEEERNFKLLEKSKSSIYTLDLNGKTSYVNPAFMKLLDVSKPEELVNQPFLPQRFWLNPKKRAPFVRRLKAGGIETMELALKTAKGRRVDVALFSAFTKNAHGEINGSQGVLYDITAKKELVALKEAEQALRESEQRYRTLAENSQVGIWQITPDGETLYVNPAMCDMLEIENPQEIAGRSFQSFLTQESIDKAKPEHPQDIVSHYEAEIVGTRSGRRTAIVAAAPLFPADNHLHSVVATFTDITERKQAEEQLNKTMDELKRFNKLAVGRELRMIELKREINDLLRELGRQEEYQLEAVETPEHESH